MASGVGCTDHERPPSRDRSTRPAVVPIQTWSRPAIVTLVPLAAKAPSPGKAGGRRSAGTCVQVRPPSAVRRMTKRPATESLTAAPWVASAKAIASKNASGSVLRKRSVQVAPLSLVW